MALLHAIVGTMIPLIMISVMTRFFGKNRTFREGLQAWKFALFAALAMTVPYYAVAVILGPEFPSLFGGLIGLLLVVSAAKKGWFLPKDGEWNFDKRENWDADWNGQVDVRGQIREGTNISMIQAWTPYLLVGLFLVLSRVTFLPIKAWMTGVTITGKDLFGSGMDVSVAPLYLPGTIFILVVFCTYFLHRMNGGAFKKAWGNAFQTTVVASVALLSAVPMVKLFIGSQDGAAGYESMPIELAEGVAALTGSAWPIFAPVIGALGAFVAGSNTISNMMFSLFQFGVGERIGVDPSWVVALQAVGGAAGNMICVHNVVAASATVGLVNREGPLIRKVLLPMTYYTLFAGGIGYVILNGWDLNIGTIIVLAVVIAWVYVIVRSNKESVAVSSKLN